MFSTTPGTFSHNNENVKRGIHYKKVGLFRPSFIGGYKKPSKKYTFIEGLGKAFEKYFFYQRIIKTFQKNIHLSEILKKIYILLVLKYLW